jgi:hypothetical protein
LIASGFDFVVGAFSAPSSPITVCGSVAGRIWPRSVPVFMPKPGAEPSMSRMPTRLSIGRGSSSLTSDSKSSFLPVRKYQSK